MHSVENRPSLVHQQLRLQRIIEVYLNYVIDCLGKYRVALYLSVCDYFEGRKIFSHGLFGRHVRGAR